MTEAPQRPRHGQQPNHAREHEARSIFPDHAIRLMCLLEKIPDKDVLVPPTDRRHQPNHAFESWPLPALDATARRYLGRICTSAVERAPTTNAFTTATSASVYFNKQPFPPPGPSRPTLQWEFPNKKNTSASGGGGHAGGLRGKYTPPARLTHASGSGLYPGGRLGRGGLKVKTGGPEKNGDVRGGEGGWGWGLQVVKKNEGGCG